jgi:hypothetical protein
MARLLTQGNWAAMAMRRGINAHMLLYKVRQLICYASGNGLWNRFVSISSSSLATGPTRFNMTKKNKSIFLKKADKKLRLLLTANRNEFDSSVLLQIQEVRQLIELAMVAKDDQVNWNLICWKFASVLDRVAQNIPAIVAATRYL